MSNTLRNYRNSIILSFEEKGENFTLKVPHRNRWNSIIRFLRKRGFLVRENASYKEHYNCLSPYHKIGVKKDVRCLLEIGSSSIKIEFGHVRNLWTRIAQSFWSDPNDDRYSKLNYLERISVELEIYKLKKYCEKFNHSFIEEDSNLCPEEYIINKLKINKHIHGDVNCLNDIKLSIDKDSYNYIHNSNDKNGKKIICGDVKYFYDYYNRRLSVGVAWHNINNMWWLIVNKKKYNIASFELFDFDPNLPRRKKVSQSELKRLLKKYEGQKDYLKCHQISRLIK